jgi:hypothetical protein
MDKVLRTQIYARSGALGQGTESTNQAYALPPTGDWDEVEELIGEVVEALDGRDAH